MVTVADEFAGSDGDIVTAVIKLLGLGPVVGARTWGGVVGIEGYQGLADGSAITVPRFAIFLTSTAGAWRTTAWTRTWRC